MIDIKKNIKCNISSHVIFYPFENILILSSIEVKCREVNCG
jgi:hypothetical protein